MEVEVVNAATSAVTIEHLQAIFATHGLPECWSLIMVLFSVVLNLTYLPATMVYDCTLPPIFKWTSRVSGADF